MVRGIPHICGQKCCLCKQSHQWHVQVGHSISVTFSEETQSTEQWGTVGETGQGLLALSRPCWAGARAGVAWFTAGPGCQLDAGRGPGPSTLEACCETWPLEEHLAADREARPGSLREAGAPEPSLISQASTGQSVKEAGQAPRFSQVLGGKGLPSTLPSRPPPCHTCLLSCNPVRHFSMRPLSSETSRQTGADQLLSILS